VENSTERRYRQYTPGIVVFTELESWIRPVVPSCHKGKGWVKRKEKKASREETTAEKFK
jgi:hypothetical protein